jgi:hypothetical protein
MLGIIYENVLKVYWKYLMFDLMVYGSFSFLKSWLFHLGRTLIKKGRKYKNKNIRHNILVVG